MPVSQRVAIIGGGCAGLTAFWALQNSVHNVHLFEASDRVGGRVKSVVFEKQEFRTNVDTEPLCFNASSSR